MIKKPEVWIIRHNETKEKWTARSGKSSWNTSGAAKNAWANSRVLCLFDDQEEYELFNLYSYQEVEEENRLLREIITCELNWEDDFINNMLVDMKIVEEAFKQHG